VGQQHPAREYGIEALEKVIHLVCSTEISIDILYIKNA